MNRIPLDRKKESQVIGSAKLYTKAYVTDVPVYNTPITPRENFRMMLDGKVPFWMPSDQDIFTINPIILPDNVSRAFVIDIEPLAEEKNGGKDMFGVDWEYVPSVGGSMVKPGRPMLSDIADWEKIVKFPNLDDYDWEGSAKKNSPYIDRNKIVMSWVFNGLFERLISFLDFEAAAMALLDEEQQEYVHALLSKLCDLYDDLFGRLQKHYGVEMIYFHDDWGSQRAPFFSLATCREMLVPYLRRVADSCHKRGMYLFFHCCGQNELLVPAMIEAGVDIWVPQTMNDVDMLLEKYGDKMSFGKTPDPLAMDASDEEIFKAAKSFVDKYKKYKNVYCFGGMQARGNPAFAKAIREMYFISREEYNKL